MFEARVLKAALWKRLIEAIKDLVSEANFDCGPGGASIQAMDPAHVALVHLLLKNDGFDMFNCPRNQMLGINLQSFSRVLKTIENNDRLTLRHEDDTDVITVIVEAESGNKISEFQLKLMEIEADSMGIPEEMDYTARVQLSSSEFAKICRDMAIFGDTVAVDVTREGVKFSGVGDVTEGFQYLKATGRLPLQQPSSEAATTSSSRVKTEVKQEPVEDDEASEEQAAGSVKLEGGEALTTTTVKKEKKVKAEAAKPDDVLIGAEEPVQLSFALRYLNTFSKGSALSERVTLNLAKESPCMIEYPIEGLGYLRWYLAPKVDDQ